MPNPLLVSGLVTVSAVATAVAIEHFVFRPWREEHWPEGIVPELQRGWTGFKEDFRREWQQIGGGADGWPPSPIKSSTIQPTPDRMTASIPSDFDMSRHMEEMEMVRRKNRTDLALAGEPRHRASRPAPQLDVHLLDQVDENFIVASPAVSRPLSPAEPSQPATSSAHRLMETSSPQSPIGASRPSSTMSDFVDAGSIAESASMEAGFKDDDWEQLSDASSEG